jgi:hypothetical protein
MTELRAAGAERGTAYSSGVDQDVGSARGSRYAERSARETAEELRYWVRNDHAERQSRAGVSDERDSQSGISAVGCVVAGCGGASTDWYTAGKA